jgi:chromosome segregation ATPase
METFLHHVQHGLDVARVSQHTIILANHVLAAEVEGLRAEVDVTSEQSGALTQQLFALRIEHDATVEKNRVLTGQLRATRLGRDRLVKKIAALQESSAVLRGKLKTAREEVVARDSTLEELEEEVGELRKENEDLLPIDEVPSDVDGMDMSDQSDQEDDDRDGEEEDPDEYVYEVDDDQE